MLYKTPWVLFYLTSLSNVREYFWLQKGEFTFANSTNTKEILNQYMCIIMIEYRPFKICKLCYMQITRVPIVKIVPECFQCL